VNYYCVVIPAINDVSSKTKPFVNGWSY
jgi:hypothetical protein